MQDKKNQLQIIQSHEYPLAAGIRAEKMTQVQPHLDKMRKVLVAANSEAELKRLDKLSALIDSMPDSWWMEAKDATGEEIIYVLWSASKAPELREPIRYHVTNTHRFSLESRREGHAEASKRLFDNAKYIASPVASFQSGYYYEVKIKYFLYIGRRP